MVAANLSRRSELAFEATREGDGSFYANFNPTIPAGSKIEVHRQPQGEQFAERALHGPGGSLNSTAAPSFTVELDRLFTA
jgi:hypothetical protein